MKIKILAALVLFLCVSQQVFAVHLVTGEDGKVMPWSMPMEHPLDQPIMAGAKDTPFSINLGPTGIRAIMEPDQPKVLKVTFVFQDAKSPAKGLIKPGDWIVGANGKQFVNDHGFHRKQAGASGWAGAPFELALAIEDSQGSDGKLKLTVFEGGSPNKRKDVTIQLNPVGKFSPTWPWNCPRTDKLNKELLDFIFEDGVPKGRPATIQCLLSLWASGDKRAIPLVKDQAEGLMKNLANPMDGGMCSWMWGYHGIFLGEYYNAFKDKGVLPAVNALIDCYETGQDWKSGGFSHRPFPAIERRVAEGGPKGYGSMAGPGGLSMLAQSIFKATGLPYSQKAYERTHQAFLRTAGGNPDGGIAYGFSGWQSVQIHAIEKPDVSKSKRGIGFISPVMLKDAGKYQVEKWTETAPEKWDMKLVDPKEFPWLEQNKATLHMYDLDKSRRLVVMDGTLPEPTAPYNTGTRGGGHNAPVGMGALAHYIGNKDNKSWNYLGKHMATCCAYSPGKTWDGHACGEMHAFFNILGAARADEKAFRSFLDYYKTLIVLSETHDGKGLVEQPFGTERYGNCSGIARNRKIFSYTTVLLFSIPKRVLLITGADYAQPAGPTTAKASYSGSSETSSSASSAPVAAAPAAAARAARTLSAERRAILDKSLLGTLEKLSTDNALTPVPLTISKTKASIWLKRAVSDGTLTFQLVGGSQKVNFQWKELSTADHATLALLVATLKPESSDAKAMTGVYMESVGRLSEADKYFAQAGEASTRKLTKLFE